jgi:hypothetical protein
MKPKSYAKSIKIQGFKWVQTLRMIKNVSPLLLVTATAFAERDLASVANSAVSQSTTVAKAAALLGLMVGAVAFQIPGAAHWAKSVFISGLIGTAIAFGGSTIMSVLRSLFGA